MSELFTESAVAPVKQGENWRAVLITPGKGSSGIYTESMLQEYGPVAFPKGTHSYIDHPVSEGEVRSPKNLMGVLANDAHYEEGVGVVAEIQVMPHWKEFVEAVAPHTGLSIYAMGEGSINEEGDVVVESLIPNMQNSVDLVSYAGRPGSGLAEKLYESAIAAFVENGAATAETETEIMEGNPDMEEIMEKLEELNVKFTALAEALRTPDEEPAEEVEAVDPNEVAAEVAEAVAEAALPAASRKAVYEAMKAGKTVEDAIVAQKELIESLKATLVESATPVVEETANVKTVEATAKLSDILNVKVGN
jgi:hypothetical protein